MKLDRDKVRALLGGEWPASVEGYEGFVWDAVDHWRLEYGEFVPYGGGEPAPGPNLKLVPIPLDDVIAHWFEVLYVGDAYPPAKTTKVEDALAMAWLLYDALGVTLEVFEVRNGERTLICRVPPEKPEA